MTITRILSISVLMAGIAILAFRSADGKDAAGRPWASDSLLTRLAETDSRAGEKITWTASLPRGVFIIKQRAPASTPDRPGPGATVGARFRGGGFAYDGFLNVSWRSAARGKVTELFRDHVLETVVLASTESNDRIYMQFTLLPARSPMHLLSDRAPPAIGEASVQLLVPRGKVTSWYALKLTRPI